ncbi:alpha/beta hydrolase [Gemmatimonas sp.]|uniref:alpha/beta hydrolase n=1 Tax=Gemmatimonas sp. TaxID=1962908 RepID=UPI00286E8CF3|nr:alpha/beta hydrolase [Gemmatimonas sp.]
MLERRIVGRPWRAVLTVLEGALALGCGAASTDSSRGPISTVLVRQRLDVAYAAVHPAQKLDLYLPPTGVGPFPLVIWIHGGGRAQGDKGLGALSVQRQLTTRGFALASLNYRLSGVAWYPAAVQDVKAAIRHLRANAERYALLPDRVALWGSSAGAHLAALVGVTGDITMFDDPALGNSTQSARVQGVVSWFAPTDILAMDSDNGAQGCPLFGGTGHDSPTSPEGLFLGARPSSVPSVARDASPVTWLTIDDPPFLLQHGGADCTVPTRQSVRLRDGLRALSGDTTRSSWTLFPVDGHGGPSFSTPANVEVVVAFLARSLR